MASISLQKLTAVLSNALQRPKFMPSRVPVERVLNFQDPAERVLRHQQEWEQSVQANGQRLLPDRVLRDLQYRLEDLARCARALCQG